METLKLAQVAPNVIEQVKKIVIQQCYHSYQPTPLENELKNFPSMRDDDDDDDKLYFSVRSSSWPCKAY